MQTSISELKSEWDLLQPLAADNERRLWQKLRLEWNYHSNHIEGNTLTYGETELLLLHDQTHGNHDIREYIEMKAHDVGIEHLRKLAADPERGIAESDIRDLNKIILKEPFWKQTETVDGQPTRKQIIPGEYKTTPNNVRTASGEIFQFAAPNEVPSKMKVLVDWISTQMEKPIEDIAAVAAKLHHEFVLVHPFDDGNGRVARMLVNYLIMRSGYPPIIIPTEQKKSYLAALRLADAGDLAELVNFLGTCLIRSLELGIKAAKGESLDEPGDVEKEIALFKRSQAHQADRVQPRTTENIRWIYDNGLRDLFKLLVGKMTVFDSLFLSPVVRCSPSSPKDLGDPLEAFQENLYRGLPNQSEFSLAFGYKGYRGEAASPFSVDVKLIILLQEFEYDIHLGHDGGSRSMTKKLYSEPVLSDEARDLVEQVQKHVLERIRSQTKLS